MNEQVQNQKKRSLLPPLIWFPFCVFGTKGKAASEITMVNWRKMLFSCWVPSWVHHTNTVDFASRWKQLILAYGYRSLSLKCLLWYKLFSYLFGILPCWDVYFLPSQFWQDKKNIFYFLTHPYFLHHSVFNFTLVVNSRFIYISLVKEAKAAGVHLSDTYTGFSYSGQNFGGSATRNIPGLGLNCQ